MTIFRHRDRNERNRRENAVSATAKVLAVLCCLALLPLSVFGEEAAAPAPAVQVLLRRLNLTDRIDLRLGCGVLAAWNGGRMQIPAGSEVTVQVRHARLILFYRGGNILECFHESIIRKVNEAFLSEGRNRSE